MPPMIDIPPIRKIVNLEEFVFNGKDPVQMIEKSKVNKHV